MEMSSRICVLHTILRNLCHLECTKIFTHPRKNFNFRISVKRTLTASSEPLYLNDQERSKNCVKLLVEHLGCSQNFSESLVKANSWLSEIPVNKIKKVASVAKNFKLSDIKNNPEIFSMYPDVLDERYLILQEIGVHNITAGKIVGFKHLTTKTFYAMQVHGVLPLELDIVDHLTSFLDCPQEIKEDIKSAHSKAEILNCEIKSIRNFIICEYLSWKFCCENPLNFESFQAKKVFKECSLTSLCKTVKILTEVFNLPFSMIISNQFLLSCSSSNLEMLSKNVSTLAGQSLKAIMIEQPHILELSADHLLQTENILKSYGFKDEQIWNFGRVFFIKPDVLKSRLNVMNRILQFPNVKSHPKVLEVLKHDLNKQLLDTVTADISFDMFLSSLKSSKSRKQFRHELNDCAQYLVSVVGGSELFIVSEVQKHPKWRTATLENTRAIVTFLLNNGITNEQLAKGLIIILYDIEIVIEIFKNLAVQNLCSSPFLEWSTNPYLIQLLVYYIEKEYHYTDNLSLSN